MITFKTQNLRLLCINAGMIALLVPGVANADVRAGGYEPDSCTPHGAIFDPNAGCLAGAFTECKCQYIPEGGSTPAPCPGAGENATPPPAGTYYYRRLSTCGLGLGPTWISTSTQPQPTVIATDAAPLGWMPGPPYSPPFTPEPGKPSCGQVVVATGVNDASHSPVVPFFDDWTHDCELPGTALVTKTQAMDGDLKVAQGSTLLAGFDFTMPGSHPAAIIGFLGPKVVFIATCASGTPDSEPIVVNIPNQAWQGLSAIPANNSAWYPSGDQNSADTYQGSETVPSFCDSDALVRLQKGGTFSTNVLSDDKQDKINVRWHYKVKDGTGGGWSGTYSVIGN